MTDNSCIPVSTHPRGFRMANPNYYFQSYKKGVIQKYIKFYKFGTKSVLALRLKHGRGIVTGLVDVIRRNFCPLLYRDT